MGQVRLDVQRLAMIGYCIGLLAAMLAIAELSGVRIAYATFQPIGLIVLLLFALLPACFGEAHFNARSYALSYRKTPERRELDYLRYAGASVETAKESKVFDLGPFLVERFRELAWEIHRDVRKLAIGRARWGGLFAAVGLVAYYLAYAVIAWRTLSGAFSIGDLTFLAGSLLRLRTLLEGLLLGVSQLAGQALYLQDLFSFFAIRPEIASPPDARRFPSPVREEIGRAHV